MRKNHFNNQNWLVTMLVLVMAFALPSQKAMAEDVAYVVYDNATTTLTFKYGEKPAGDNVYEIIVSYYRPAWSYPNLEEKVTTVVFDKSFANARPTDCYAWFGGLHDLTDIVDIQNLNTSEVTSMFFMFKGCSSLQSIDLSSFNTEKVEHMASMFEGCSSLQSIDLSSFNTEKVEYMDGLFAGCSSLKSIDLSSFNTKNVISISGMFEGCSSLESIDLSPLNAVERHCDLLNLFSGCTSLRNIDLSPLKKISSFYMSGMFEGCSNLESIDNLSSLCFDNLMYAGNMFAGCSKLQSLDFSSFSPLYFDVSLNGMFEGCSSLQTIDLSSHPFMCACADNMFKDCPALTTIYVCQNIGSGGLHMSATHVFDGSPNIKGASSSSDYVPSEEDDWEKLTYTTGYLTKKVGMLGNEILGAVGERLSTLTKDSLTLSDELDFELTDQVRAHTVSYNRAISSTWESLCLPFAISLESETPFKAFTIDSLNDDVVVLTECSDEIPAGCPVLIKMNEGEETIRFELADALLVPSYTISSADESLQLFGTYSERTFTSDENNYYMVNDDLLMNPARLLENSNLSSVSLKPFRAYAKDCTSSAQTSQARSLSFEIADKSTDIGELNAIVTDDADYFDLQGHRTNGLQKGLNIVKRGNKTMKVIIK